MNPGDTNSESVAGSLISNGETLQLSGVRVQGFDQRAYQGEKSVGTPRRGRGQVTGDLRALLPPAS